MNAVAFFRNETNWQILASVSNQSNEQTTHFYWMRGDRWEWRPFDPSLVAEGVQFS